MSERIEINGEGELPDDGKYAVLAAVEEKLKAAIKEINDACGLKLTISVRPVRSSRKKAPAVVAAPEVTEPPASEATTLHPRRGHVPASAAAE